MMQSISYEEESYLKGKLMLVIRHIQKEYS